MIVSTITDDSFAPKILSWVIVFAPYAYETKTITHDRRMIQFFCFSHDFFLLPLDKSHHWVGVIENQEAQEYNDKGAGNEEKPLDPPILLLDCLDIHFA